MLASGQMRGRWSRRRGEMDGCLGKTGPFQVINTPMESPSRRLTGRKVHCGHRRRPIPVLTCNLNGMPHMARDPDGT